MNQSTMQAVGAAMFFGVVGTGIGGLIGLLIGKPSDKWLSCLLNGTGGFMIAVVCFELLPESYALDVRYSLFGVLLGMGMMLLGDALVQKQMRAASSMARAGLMVAVGIALHNFPEGLAVGSGYAQAPTLGLALGLMIALHDVPEGIATAVPLRVSGTSALKVLMITLASGLPTGLGALLGVLAGGVSQQMIALCLGMAGGAMLQITAQELLPQASDLDKSPITTVCLALGVALGSATSLIV